MHFQKEEEKEEVATVFPLSAGQLEEASHYQPLSVQVRVAEEEEEEEVISSFTFAHEPQHFPALSLSLTDRALSYSLSFRLSLSLSLFYPLYSRG